MEVGISAIGTAVPPFSYTQKEIIDFITDSVGLNPTEKRRLGAVYRATGIERRYSVLNDHLKSQGNYTFFPNKSTESFPSTKKRMELYRENAPSLAINAVTACLETFVEENKRSVLDGITHVITVSCTGMYAPGLDIDIIRHFKMQTTIHRTAINFMGCYGAFNAIKTAYAICKADKHASVLIICLELCSIHFQAPKKLDQLISTSVFGDGAAALIIQSHSKSYRYLKLEDFYCNILPQSDKEMTWRIADSGFDIVLSSYVPELIQSGIASFFDIFLQKKSLTLQDIQQYAIHPGGMKILQACESALGITKDHNRFSYDVLRDYGNMSSATIVFVLKKIWDQLMDSSTAQNILCCAFGPGLTLESMLISYSHG